MTNYMCIYIERYIYLSDIPKCIGEAITQNQHTTLCQISWLCQQMPAIVFEEIIVDGDVSLNSFVKVSTITPPILTTVPIIFPFPPLPVSPSPTFIIYNSCNSFP